MKNKHKIYIGSRSEYLEEVLHNLVLIVSKENGMIPYEDIEISPYTFFENFSYWIHSIPAKINVNGFTKSRNISKVVKEQTIHDVFNPLKNIEIRKRGLVIGSLLSAPEGLNYYHNKRLKKGGYFLGFRTESLNYLVQSCFEYEVYEWLLEES